MAYRNKAKLIKFSPEEWEMVCKRAADLNQRTGTYIRRIAVRGEIKFFDMKQFNHLTMSFCRIANELNQIAKVANSTQSVYAKDIEDIKKSFDYLETIFANYLQPIVPLKILKDE
ncbi:MAG: MobC family plasmid mobilization relaxosome protein [Ruminococcus flavefaciens]|nr:MobC family plasmid mobilization relaxosome protein [Ruminococcus flavefaciens]